MRFCFLILAYLLLFFFSSCVTYEYGTITYAEINHRVNKNTSNTDSGLNVRCGSGGITFFDNIYSDIDKALTEKHPNGLQNFEAGVFKHKENFGELCIGARGANK